jgi:hypothetical protein
MEAARLMRARRRMRGYFFGSGVIMAFLFLLLAAVVIHWIGLEWTSYIATLVFAAGVMAGGAYGFILFGALAVHVVRRLITRQPVMDYED